MRQLKVFPFEVPLLGQNKRHVWRFYLLFLPLVIQSVFLWPQCPDFPSLSLWTGMMLTPPGSSEVQGVTKGKPVCLFYFFGNRVWVIVRDINHTYVQSGQRLNSGTTMQSRLFCAAVGLNLRERERERENTNSKETEPRNESGDII